MANNKNHLILMVVITSIASQIYMNMFVDGFIIALSVVMMGFFLYIFKEIEATIACILIGICSPLFRLFIVLLGGGKIEHSLSLVLPDMAFFFAYSFIFGVVLKRLGYSPYTNYYIRLAASDFFSNCSEMAVRSLILYTNFSIHHLRALIILALLRSFLILLLCIIADLYTSLLTKQEHEENYQKLTLMASTFKSEVYFMEKNINEIEEIMKNAFTLYRTMEEEDYPKEMQNIALEIAKDIHEVKKGYRRVIIGLEDNFLSELSYSPLKLSEILKILSTHIEHNAANRKLDVVCSYQIQKNHFVGNHFALMSILRNLVSNSLDSFEDQKQEKGTIQISCTDIVKSGETFCQIKVSDNGSGIPQKLIDVIFEPGFSTKYNKKTGDINRGLGLTLVHDLTQDKFNGKISVESSKDGTTFTICIPLNSLNNDIDIEED